MKAAYTRYDLHFAFPAGTSRGVLTHKETYFIKVWHDDRPDVCGIGECALFRGLSADDRPDYEKKLREVCADIDRIDTLDLSGWSSIRFGVETALLDLRHGGVRRIFPTPFFEGKERIVINGLIWMGDKETMHRCIEEKLQAGFRCIKLKIGAIDFRSELELLAEIRARYTSREVKLRVDANGTFTPDNVREHLDRLARYDIHSIEQPIRAGQWQALAELCRDTPVPIALDEELIGVEPPAEKEALLDAVRPQYIVLKPALTGGFSGAAAWIEAATARRIGWWVTSALESNIGLNAIAQWVSSLSPEMPQGLGTGRLYTDNIPSPLRQQGETLSYDPAENWDTSKIIWK